MAAMTRELLTQMLKAAPGIEGKGAKYETQEGHRVSFYLGQEGRGIVVNEVLNLELHDAFLQLTTEEQGEIFTAYESVHSLTTKALKEHAPKRTGFE